MARSKALSARINERLTEAVQPPVKSDPVVAAVLFSHATHNEGGATLNLGTNRLINPGTEAYMVGGERNTVGERVPTKMLNSVPPLSALQMMEHVRKETGGTKGASVGSWKNPKTGEFELDASRSYPNKEWALSTAKKRNEAAIFNMKTMEDIPNPSFDPNKPQV